MKPHGWPVDERVKAADQSIALGDLEPLKGLVEPDKWPELQRRFQKVMSLKDFDVNRVEEGREYIEAYVQFSSSQKGKMNTTNLMNMWNITGILLLNRHRGCLYPGRPVYPYNM